MANGFEIRLISPSARRTPSGLVLDIRLPWYRALPLSTVEVTRLEVDGREIPADRLSLELNGKTFALAALGDLVSEWWFTLDSAFLHVNVPDIAPGPHAVDLTLTLYPPYIPGLTWVTRSQRELQAA